MACGQVVGSLRDQRLTQRFANRIRRLEQDAAATPLARVPRGSNEQPVSTSNSNCSDDNDDDKDNQR